MAKLADAADLKSAGRKAVGVQVPLWAPENRLAARIRAAILLGSCSDGGREDRPKDLMRRTVQGAGSVDWPGAGWISGSGRYDQIDRWWRCDLRQLSIRACASGHFF
jgi:hypothetical protein